MKKSSTFPWRLEWIRRNTPKFDEALKTYLFTTGEITKLEEAATGGKDTDS